MILGQQNQFSKALKFSNDLLKLTADTPESNFFVLANMLDYMNSEKLNGKMQIGKYFAVVDLLKRSNFFNNTVYTILCTPWFYLQTNEFLSTLLEYIEDAKLLAEKIGNHFGLSTACHWKGIILSKLGNKKEAFNWYRRCNAIRNKIGNKIPMTKRMPPLPQNPFDPFTMTNPVRVISIKDTANTSLNVVHHLPGL